MSRRNIKRGSWGVALAALLLSLALGGCSSGNDNATSAASAPASSTVSAAKGTGKTILLGNIGSYSASSGLGYNAAILKNWVQTVNSRGGINGHPVEIKVQDDAGDATKSLTEAKSLIENDHVIGFVGNFQSITGVAIDPYIQQKGVPVVGGDASANPPWFVNPMLFPVTSDPTLSGISMMEESKKAGITKIAIWRNSNGAQNNLAAVNTEKAAPKYGVSIVDKQTVALATPNFQSQCLQSQHAGATALFYVADTGTVARAQSSCARINYRPAFLLWGVQPSPAQATVPKSVVLGTMQVFPYFLNTGTPALTEWGKATAGAPKDAVGAKTAYAWASVKLAELALERGIPKDATPTTAGLLNGLYTIKDETLGGLTVPLTFPKAAVPKAGACWFPFTVRNQTFTAETGTKPACA
jgi:branched-chain amino acid transport system substrate-binding protein